MRLRAAVTGLLIAAGCGAGASAAQACSVAVGPGFTPRSRVARADAAATVRVLRVTADPASFTDPEDVRYTALLQVSRVYKGSLPQRIRVRGGTATSLCEVGELRRGQRLGLLLDDPRPYRLGILSRISARDLETATGGASRAPRR